MILIVALEAVGVLCSETKHTVDGYEFCCEGKVYFRVSQLLWLSAGLNK